MTCRKRLAIVYAALACCAIHTNGTQAAEPPELTLGSSATRSFGVKTDNGRPDLRMLSALITAGGGTRHFKSTTLVRVLAGSNAGAMVSKLVERYGANDVRRFVTTLDFSVADSLGALAQMKLPLPAEPLLDPPDGRALCATLYNAGLPNSTAAFSLDSMLDRLLSRALRVRLMNDIDTKYGRSADVVYHRMAQQIMSDLKSAYDF